MPAVLVVEADASLGGRLGQQIADAGFSVLTARTGFEALVKAACQVPDVILVADTLGDIGPDALAQLLSTCPATAHIRVLRLRRGRALAVGTLDQLRQAV